jgi:hypothetical protein
MVAPSFEIFKDHLIIRYVIQFCFELSYLIIHSQSSNLVNDEGILNNKRT